MPFTVLVTGAEFSVGAMYSVTGPRTADDGDCAGRGTALRDTAWCCFMAYRFSNTTVKTVLEEVTDTLLRDKEYDPENSIELVKSVADEVQARLKNS